MGTASLDTLDTNTYAVSSGVAASSSGGVTSSSCGAAYSSDNAMSPVGQQPTPTRIGVVTHTSDRTPVHHDPAINIDVDI